MSRWQSRGIDQHESHAINTTPETNVGTAAVTPPERRRTLRDVQDGNIRLFDPPRATNAMATASSSAVQYASQTTTTTTTTGAGVTSSAPPTTAPAATTPGGSQAMVGYSTTPNSAMDLDQQDDRRGGKDPSSSYQYQNGSNGTPSSSGGLGGSRHHHHSSSGHHDRHHHDQSRNRSVRSRHHESNGGEPSAADGHRSRSGRPSSRSSSRTRSQSQHQQHHAQNHPQHRSPSNGPSPSHFSQQQPFHQHRPQTAATNAAPSGPAHGFPPQSQAYRAASPDNAQPTFPPPAVTADSPTQTQPQPSQRRPAYLLHRDLVIGKGSYGQVCIASRGEPEGHSGRSGKRKKFACKCVMLRNDPKYIAKLQEEVNVLRELRGHQNVIVLYDVYCVDNELFIITELGRGGDLFHLLTTHPKHGVTESYAAKTVVEMLSAVAFLHSRHICHRDLKLENWVLESGKDVWSPLKLIDFGLSTHFTPGQRLSRVVGSSYYVAPEVLKKSYTEACDLWSLGVIVYMLLSGAPPFYGKNDEAIKASIVQGEYTFPHELFRDVSDEAMAFVSTLLSYNTEYRYTAEQALTHPWLASNIDPDALRKAKDGARGIGIAPLDSRVEPMQL